jgi:hypothetical protein
MTILDDTTIRDLIGFTDPQGVISIYIGHTPAQAADPYPTTPTEIRNQCRHLVSELGTRDPDLARAVQARIEAIGDDLTRLLDPRAHGRGRALFVGVEGGERTSLALQLPFRDRVVHHESAYVRPLVAAHDEGRAAGVLVVSRSGTRLLEWHVGEVSELDVRVFELGDAQLADVKSGPANANPQHTQHSVNHRERFDDRIDENRGRFLREVAEQVQARVDEHGWDRLVLAGPAKVRDSLRGALQRDDGFRVLTADHQWEDAAPHVVADQVGPLLRAVHRDREQELVAAAMERALAGGAGALGLAAVCDALNEGRVGHLLYDDRLSITGVRSAAGTLHPEATGLLAEADVAMTAEPLLVERMVERAIATSGQVTPLVPEVAVALEDHDGVAALLRW